MAGYPPPYPPSGSGPDSQFGYPSRQERRWSRQQARFARQQLKAQVRAQKLAFRAQRDLFRQQTRAMRRSSVVGPLLIVAIGVILLLIQFGTIEAYRFEAWYGRFWPLVLIAAGLILVFEWAFDRYSSQTGVPSVRRGVGGGAVFLLIVLGAIGSSIDSWHSDSPFLGWKINSNDLGEFFGERHEFEQQIDQPFEPGTLLNVENPHGDVTIVGTSADHQIHVVVNKQVYSWGDDNAKSRADQLSPRITFVGGTLSVDVPNLDAAHADLAITVPQFAQATVNANHGAVTISDLHAPVNVTTNGGDVELDRIVGTVGAHLSNSDSSLSAHDVKGDLTVRGHLDECNLTGIAGAVSLEGEFSGDSHFEHLTGPVSFRTHRTIFTVARLDGVVDISSGQEMTGSELVGPTELHTRSRDISFERITGAVTITNSRGTVDLTNASPLGDVSVENSDGAITVTVPERAGLTINALTKEGAIHDEIENVMIPESGVAVHRDILGNGAAHMTLHTTHADITIHKGIVEPPAATPALTKPTQPEAPANRPTQVPEAGSKTI